MVLSQCSACASDWAGPGPKTTPALKNIASWNFSYLLEGPVPLGPSRDVEPVPPKSLALYGRSPTEGNPEGSSFYPHHNGTP